MSLKAKDLQYGKSSIMEQQSGTRLTRTDNAQPAFLRRLRGELAGDGSGRHDRPNPINKKLKTDDEEDAPTYVMENTNQSLSKAEYEAMVAGKDPKEDEGGEKANDAVASANKKDNIAEVGKASKKRKVAKVIGEEKDEDPKGEVGSEKVAEKKVIKKAKKKVKLSFGDDEG
jgi:hypothetical protein